MPPVIEQLLLSAVPTRVAFEVTAIDVSLEHERPLVAACVQLKPTSLEQHELLRGTGYDA